MQMNCTSIPPMNHRLGSNYLLAWASIGSSQSSGILSTETNSNLSSRMSALTFFLFFTETYSSAPLSFRFFFLPMAPFFFRSSRPAVVMVLFFLLDRLCLLSRLVLRLRHILLTCYLGRPKLPVVSLLAPRHFLLDGFETLDDHT